LTEEECLAIAATAAFIIMFAAFLWGWSNKKKNKNVKTRGKEGGFSWF
jgi:hypothetical protein